MTGSRKKRLTEEELIARLRLIIENEELKEGTAYSAEEVAGKLGCSALMVKRFMPVVVAALKIPARLEWQKREIGSNTRYTLIVRDRT